MSLFNKVLQARSGVMYKLFYRRLLVVLSHTITFSPKLLLYGPRADNPQHLRSDQAINIHRKGSVAAARKNGKEWLAIYIFSSGEKHNPCWAHK